MGGRVRLAASSCLRHEQEDLQTQRSALPRREAKVTIVHGPAQQAVGILRHMVTDTTNCERALSAFRRTVFRVVSDVMVCCS